ncbi:hypothetical protein CPK_ORF00520 [Chlamydia pneumoniae LPCoLN]|nr:hypothetical protein CPK_ORF00520 [Chlamydia pneumoniae LPCoLN]
MSSHGSLTIENAIDPGEVSSDMGFLLYKKRNPMNYRN